MLLPNVCQMAENPFITYPSCSILDPLIAKCKADLEERFRNGEICLDGALGSSKPYSFLFIPDVWDKPNSYFDGGEEDDGVSDLVSASCLVFYTALCTVPFFPPREICCCCVCESVSTFHGSWVIGRKSKWLPSKGIVFGAKINCKMAWKQCSGSHARLTQTAGRRLAVIHRHSSWERASF